MSHMKSIISKVEVFGVAVPLVGGGFKNAYVTKTVQKSAVIRITDDDGIVGLGNIDVLHRARKNSSLVPSVTVVLNC